MMNYAHSTNVYQVWADMVCFDERRTEPDGTDAFCVYASRRDAHAYAHSHEEVMARFGDALRRHGQLPVHGARGDAGAGGEVRGIRAGEGA